MPRLKSKGRTARFGASDIGANEAGMRKWKNSLGTSTYKHIYGKTIALKWRRCSVRVEKPQSEVWGALEVLAAGS